jgi:50S ribosomal subunit-associated GTPase HflX
LVFNKADLVDSERVTDVLAAHPGSIAIAAAKREGLSALLSQVDRSLSELRAKSPHWISMA